MVAKGGRSASVRRATAETDVSVSVNIDGAGRCSTDTGIGFLDHMITSLAKHSMIDLEVGSKSLDGIRHHLVEDTAIVIGDAISKALGNRQGIIRFGHASVPMDESLAEAAVDMVMRPHLQISLKLSEGRIEDMASEDVAHFFRSLLANVNCCAHLAVRYGDNGHHISEAAVKSLAVALRTAMSPDPARTGAPSTKGAM